jgi:hypothetical protein
VKAFKAVIFWLLIAFSGVGAWWSMKGEPIGPRVREGLEIGAFVVLVQLFLGRFSGQRRRIATIMVFAALFAVVAGAAATWELQLLRFGYGGPNGLVEVWMAILFFAISASIAVWSFSTPSEVEDSELGPNSTLGVKCDNRESVHGPKKVA